MVANRLTINSLIRFSLLLVFGVCVFGLNNYFMGVGMYPIPPLVYTVLSLTLFILFVFLNPDKLVHFFSLPIIIFLMIILFFIFHYLFFQGSNQAFNSVRAHINALVYFPIWYLLFQMDEILLHRAQKVMAWVVALTIPMLVFHVFFPFSFTPLELSNPGRASGFYLNPNLAGMAMVMCMLSSISIIPAKWKSLFLVWAGIGVFVTFSRSSILLFAIVSMGLVITNQVNRRQALLVFSSAILLVSVSAIGAYEYLKTTSAFNVDNVIDRLLWFQNMGQGTDYSAMARKQLFWDGLRLGMENPMLGQGAGALAHWPANLHNMYLLLLVEYGIVGLLIWPIFVLFLFLQGLRTSFHPLLLLSIVIGINGFFSHNIIDDYTTLICSALLYAASGKSPQLK